MLTNNARISILREQIREQFCSGVELHDFGEDTWAVSTPFLYGDGDGLPVMIERTDRGWRLSDQGNALDRWELDYPGYGESEEHLKRARHLVESFGAEFVDHAITIELPRGRMPNGFDVAYFLRIVAALDVLPRRTTEHRTHFRPAVKAVIGRVVAPNAVEERYFAAPDKDQLWPVEYRIKSQTGILLTWAVGGSGRASHVTSNILVHRSTYSTPGDPVVILRNSPKLSDREAARIQDLVPADNIIRTEPGADSSLIGGLQRLGVPLVSS